MGRHAIAAPPKDARTTLWRRILLGFLILCGIATSIGLVMLWPPDEDPVVAPEFTNTFALNQAQVNGEVSAVAPGACQSPSLGQVFETSPSSSAAVSGDTCTNVIVDITSGENEGRRTLLITYGQPGEPVLAEGDQIRLAETVAADGQLTYTFTDYQRGTPLLVWGLVIAGAIILFAALRGIRALVGLVITLAVLAVFLLPALVHGGAPLALAVVAGAVILFLVVLLVHGFNWKSCAALAGTLISLGIAAWLASQAISSTHLQGLGSEDNLRILLYLPEVSVTGLMLCGFIIGALGVLNDVTISQASTVNELSELDPSASPLQLFTGAMKVGRDHISSMVYTLVLTYTGAALPLLLLISVSERPLLQTLTSDLVATELLRSGVGALALTLAVPITTVIAAYVVPERQVTSQVTQPA
ncbi:YibE/F family protein [Corynebacterium halotolerans]|uniref:YibE/F family protein n=1 Tax=Corynebacterium halotolerans TaxID=225326 RepID=UPI003CEB78DF